MLAIDTNVLVRYLTGDDPAQAARARRVVEGNEVFVPASVLLETEWVLRGVYRFTAPEIVAGLRGFAGLCGVSVENAAQAAQALEWYARGMDFADALHLAGSAGCEAFVTFHTGLAKAGRRLTDLEIRLT